MTYDRLGILVEVVLYKHASDRHAEVIVCHHGTDSPRRAVRGHPVHRLEQPNSNISLQIQIQKHLFRLDDI